MVVPPPAPATRGGRGAQSPPYQLALSLPALQAGNWEPHVTVEVRPTEVRLLLAAGPTVERAKLARPQAAIHTKEGALLWAGEADRLRWLTDGSNRALLTVWRARSPKDRLASLVDPDATDALVVWIVP